jgi:hypothetical protein
VTANRTATRAGVRAAWRAPGTRAVLLSVAASVVLCWWQVTMPKGQHWRWERDERTGQVRRAPIPLLSAICPSHSCMPSPCAGVREVQRAPSAPPSLVGSAATGAAAAAAGSRRTAAADREEGEAGRQEGRRPRDEGEGREGHTDGTCLLPPPVGRSAPSALGVRRNKKGARTFGSGTVEQACRQTPESEIAASSHAARASLCASLRVVVCASVVLPGLLAAAAAAAALVSCFGLAEARRRRLTAEPTQPPAQGRTQRTRHAQ